jgi:hypothetical protein
MQNTLAPSEPLIQPPPPKPAEEHPVGDAPLPSDDLADQLDRLEREERIERDRREQDRLARLRELARFD